MPVEHVCSQGHALRTVSEKPGGVLLVLCHSTHVSHPQPPPPNPGVLYFTWVGLQKI